MNKNKKVIFHIDGDSFFVSAELSIRPELRGKDVVISYNKSHSIATAISYSMKAKGAKVPMKIYEIKKINSNYINLLPNYPLYNYVSKRVYDYLTKNYSAEVEIGSIDEWYIDVTKFSKKYNSPIILAKKIQKEIFEQIGIDVSIGISYNKWLAKMATELKKPKGISIIRKKDIKEKIWPLNIESFLGIGKSISKKLKNENILTIGDLAKIKKNNPIFLNIFKNNFDFFINNANGIGNDKIDISYNESESIGAQKTFDNKITNDMNEIISMIKKLCLRVSNDLKKRNMCANAASLIIKYETHKMLSTTKKSLIPLSSFDEIYDFIIPMLKKIWNEEPILMVGISVSSLKTLFNISKNISLFEVKKENDNKNIINIINNVNKKIKSNNLKLLANKIDC